MGGPSTTSITREATQDLFKWLLLASCLGGTMPATMLSAPWVSIHAHQNVGHSYHLHTGLWEIVNLHHAFMLVAFQLHACYAP